MMLDFEFELMSDATINIRYNYGGEWFTFNMFQQEDSWILHPFDGSLLGNRDVCRLVVADLFNHKPFQVMLARERIPLSNIRTSIDLEPESTPTSRSRRIDRNPIDDEIIRDGTRDDIDDFIQHHSLEDVLDQEIDYIQNRASLYKEILQRMFMDGLGPTDIEFQKIQEVVRAYSDMLAKVVSINNSR
ncbi:hypothetical protein [Paenibacillus sp. 481]|uniref:hypothetical protein n=1 Tax=Paenibacillus sp. 481 TaxID=2835869 RepID=UPI001E57DDAB|nr:hypothetical protein [Paenibacillus sp. 481]UHA74794.1 hypothetical protein KIK04_06965 [Paenibacillus sp. 481]